jgi:putative acetyltransferase
MEIIKLEEKHFPQVIEIWEASVRETHDFLKEEDIHLLKPMLLNTVLAEVNLVGILADQLVGFYGNVEQKLEMLFIHPDYLRNGYGKALLQHAIDHHKIRSVDVNEQNSEAIQFYKQMGFKQIGRSERDAMGKPYPLLHLEM